MSVFATARVWQSALKGNELTVALAMADVADETGEHIFPSIARLCWMTSLTRNTVRTAVKKLIARKVLRVTAPASWVDHRPVEYALNYVHLPVKLSWEGFRDRFNATKNNTEHYLDYLAPEKREGSKLDPSPTSGKAGVNPASEAGVKSAAPGVNGLTPNHPHHITKAKNVSAATREARRSRTSAPHALRKTVQRAEQYAGAHEGQVRAFLAELRRLRDAQVGSHGDPEQEAYERCIRAADAARIPRTYALALCGLDPAKAEAYA